jgi:hypothetical protein
MMERRIDSFLDAVGRRLTVFQDGIANWDERLPEFRGFPRRWAFDDATASTVGEALLSRYGGYDWFVIEQLMRPNESLDRAYSRGRMNADQQTTFLSYRQILEELRPKAQILGLASGWPPKTAATNQVE